MNSKRLKKGIGLILLFIILYKVLEIDKHLSFELLKEKKDLLIGHYKSQPLLMIGSFVVTYIVSVAFSFPVASIFALAAGAMFGLKLGTLLVSFSSTMGATIVFFEARYFLRDYLETKFKSQFTKMNKGIEKEGIFYLFTLRLLPIFPFFLINILMGLTKISPFDYFWVSLIGMLPGTIIYVNAGTQLSKISSLKEVTTPPVLISLALLGIAPLLFKEIINHLRKNKNFLT